MAGSRHIFLYGPPAAGKLTVARCLAAAYGLKLLDNTVTIEVARRLFDFGTKAFEELVDRLRLDLAAAAAAAGVDVVSTFVYGHPVDRGYVDRVVATVKAEGGTVTFVQLLPPAAVLEDRVTQASRATMTKIRDVERLRHSLASYDLSTPINAGDLSIDNSDIPPESRGGADRRPRRPATPHHRSVKHLPRYPGQMLQPSTQAAAGSRRQTATISALRMLATRTLQQSTTLRPSRAKKVVNWPSGW